METLIYRGRTSAKNYIGHFVLAGVCVMIGFPVMMVSREAFGFGLGIAVVGLLAFGGEPFLRVLASEFTVTTERVHQRAGLIARNTSEIEVRDIRNVQVKQGVLRRLLGIGDVGISTAGQSGFEITFAGIADPHGVAELVRQVRQRSEETRNS